MMVYACPDPSPERFEIGFVATGHNQLAVPQVVKQIIPAGNIQLAHHIIEQHDWVFPNGLPDQLTFCQLERKHTAALLPLRIINSVIEKPGTAGGQRLFPKGGKDVSASWTGHSRAFQGGRRDI